MDGPEVSSEITSTTLVSCMHCVWLHCHTEVSHLITNRLFGLLKKQFIGCQFHSNEEVEMAIHERLQIQESSLCCDNIFKLVPKWDRRWTVMIPYYNNEVYLVF